MGKRDIPADGIRDVYAVRLLDLRALLREDRKQQGCTVAEYAIKAEVAERQMRRLLYPAGHPEKMVSLKLADKVTTALGLQLPPIYRRTWVIDE